MNSEQKQTLIAFIKGTIDQFPPYDFNTFIDDAIEIRANFKSITKTNRVNLISSINKLRQILKQNQKVFIPVFTNVFPHFLELIKNENAHNVPEEALFLIFDVFQALMMNISFQSKWKMKLFDHLLRLSSILNNNIQINKNNSNNDLIKAYVDFILQFFIESYRKNINLLMTYFKSTDKHLQATAALLFFNNLNLFTEEKVILKEINWECLLSDCTKVIRDEFGLYNQENKNCCAKIYQQIYSLYSRGQEINKIIWGILLQGTQEAAADFGKVNGINTKEVMETLQSMGKE